MDRVSKAVLQSGVKGIRAVEIAHKLGIDKPTVYSHLNSLKLRGLVESDQGIWRAKTGKRTIKPLEKEIVIELPLPKKECQRMALLEEMAQIFHEPEQKTANFAEILLKKFMETRTIRIKGKNVDALDLEKLRNLIQQANEKSLMVSLKGLLKSLKR